MQDFVSPSDLKHIIINNDTKRKERGIISKKILKDYDGLNICQFVILLVLLLLLGYSFKYINIGYNFYGKKKEKSYKEKLK